MEKEVAKLLDVLCRNNRVSEAMQRMGVFVVDHQDYRRDAETAHVHPGYKEPFQTASAWLDFVHPEDRDRVEAAWQSVIDGHTDVFISEYRFRKPDGHYRWIKNRGTVVYRTDDGYPWIFLGADTDISELKRIEAELLASQSQLRDSLLQDPQLGIPNRRFLDEHSPLLFERARTDQSNLTVLVCDIDHFKVLNDTLGHRTADGIMARVVAAIGDCLRGTDIIARFGGDEFVVLLANTRADTAAEIAQRMIEAVRSLSHEPADAPFGISIGGYSGQPLAHDDLWSFFEKADAALYQAKRQGRGCFVAGH